MQCTYKCKLNKLTSVSYASVLLLIMNFVITLSNLAYGNCARSTSGSQNLRVLPRLPITAFLFAINKTVSKLLWPLQVVNLKIPGLI